MIKSSNYNSWVYCAQANPHAQMRLFCFPYAGGRALNYRSWSDHLPMSVEVCAIELPGRGNRLREALFTRIKPLVEKIAENILPLLDKPFALFGHSMGALLCFELTRFLREQYNIKPVHLFVSARRAPQSNFLETPIHNLPEAEFLAELRRLNGTQTDILENAELMQLLLPILRSDFEIVETYIYQASTPLECPITAFGGLSDTEASIDELKAWAEQTNSTFSIQMFMGDHFFIHSAQSQLFEYLNKYFLTVA